MMGPGTVLLLAAAAAFAAARPAGAVIAVLDVGRGLAPLASLVEAGLTAKGVPLGDRAAIGRILSEQGLVGAGILSHDGQVTVGRLARADLLLLNLEAGREGAAPFLRCRLIAASSGVRLADFVDSWEARDAAKAAGRIVERLRDPIRKLDPSLAGTAVGVMDFRPVELPAGHGLSARGLSRSLSSVLSRHPGLIVLEREDMRLVFGEKFGTPGEGGRFAGSALLVDGTLERAVGGGIECRVRVRDGRGSVVESFAEALENDDTAGAARRVAARIAGWARGGTVPAEGWIAEREAAEFHSQGLILLNHRWFAAAAAAFENASALVPENPAYAGLFSMSEMAARQLREATLTDLELAELVARVVDLERAACRSGGPPVKTAMGVPSPFIIFSHAPFLGEYFAGADSVSSAAVRDMNRRSRALWAECARRRLSERLQAEGNPPSGLLPSRTSPEMSGIFVEFAAWDTGAEAAEGMCRAYAAAVLPPEKGGTVASPERRYWLCRAGQAQMRDLVAHLDRSQIVAGREKVRGRVEECFASLRACGDPTVGFVLSAELADAGNGYYAQARDLFLRLASPAESGQGAAWDVYVSAHRTIVESLRRVFRADEKALVAELESLVLPAIRGGDAGRLLAWRPGRNFRDLFEYPACSGLETARRYVALLRRSEEVLGARTDDRARVAVVEIRDAVAHIGRRFPAAGNGGEERRAVLAGRQELPLKYSFQTGRISGRIAVRGTILWFGFADVTPGRPTLVLAGYDLEKRELAVLWRMEPKGSVLPPPGPGADPLQRSTPGFVSGMVLGESATYISYYGIGVARFPGIGVHGTGELPGGAMLTEKDGLPSAAITGMTGCETSLWIGYGRPLMESGLGRYTPAARRWDRVLCSAVANPGHPFGSGESYWLDGLWLHGESLFFRARMASARNGPRLGLWRMDTTTGAVSLFSIHGATAIPDARGVSVENMLQGGGMFGRTDPETGKPVFILVNPVIVSRLEPGAMPDMDPVLSGPWARSVPEDMSSYGLLRLSSAGIREDEMWVRYGESRIAVVRRGGLFGDAVILPGTVESGDRLLFFVGTPQGMVGIGEGMIGMVSLGPAAGP